MLSANCVLSISSRMKMEGQLSEELYDDFTQIRPFNLIDFQCFFIDALHRCHARLFYE